MIGSGSASRMTTLMVCMLLSPQVNAATLKPNLLAPKPVGAVFLYPWGAGEMTITHGDLLTASAYGDMTLHVEFRIPPSPPQATGQDRGNSGVYLQCRYEIQILDSYGRPPEINGCGSIYQQRAPTVNATLPAGQWQSYEITFRAARWDAAGHKTANARVTVVQNGVTVQSDEPILNKTGHGEPEGPALRPLKLQDHGHPVTFRNVWAILPQS
jgi:hypothetical protein